MLLPATTADAHWTATKVCSRALPRTRPRGSNHCGSRFGEITFRGLTKSRLPGTTNTSRQTFPFRLRPTTPSQ